MSLAQQYLESQGWDVDDISHEREGFDLLARTGGETLHVEVKGLSTASAPISLTVNELRRARKDPQWALIVCVLDRMTVSRIDRDAVAELDAETDLTVRSYWWETWTAQLSEGTVRAIIEQTATSD